MRNALHDWQFNPETDGREWKCNGCGTASHIPHNTYCAARMEAELRRRNDEIKRVGIKRLSLKYVTYEECRFCGAEVEGLVGSLALDRHKPDCIYLYVMGEK